MSYVVRRHLLNDFIVFIVLLPIQKVFQIDAIRGGKERMLHILDVVS